MQDEDGYIWYAGRADDVIIAAGYRIGPFEVESACLEHAAVKEAAAVASPDEVRGNVVKAFIVLAEGHEPSDELVKDIQAPRPRAPARVRLSAPDRVRRRPAQDADRQDPPDRAARARDGGGEAVASGAMAEAREIGVVGAGSWAPGSPSRRRAPALRVTRLRAERTPLRPLEGAHRGVGRARGRGGKLTDADAARCRSGSRARPSCTRCTALSSSIEAIVEDLEVKRAMFQRLDDALDDST